ncbi:hypothetical protein GCM10008955_38410 [Deinococcus malanensis]|uniref:RNase H type-1 domain-containing protein n=1 Tax=Deinococcus malanensis TaxID=1706855 RepID=A0ABQ2F2J5_9DEIO|nr:RNase H family protein [Deinococcus malanensis]GGK40932.1 hypothetical protein GCM10008955_38410 [Deinococcus malanensis]
MIRQIVLATDGSYHRKSGRGGWAAVCTVGEQLWSISSHVNDAHSAHWMELLAIPNS